MDSISRTKVAQGFATSIARELTKSISQNIGEPWPLEVTSDSTPATDSARQSTFG